MCKYMGFFSGWKEPPDPLVVLTKEIVEMRAQLTALEKEINRYIVRTDDLITGMMDLYKAENDDIAALHRDIAKLLPITVSVPPIPKTIIEPGGKMYDAHDPESLDPRFISKYQTTQAAAAMETAKEITVNMPEISE
jgi:hypothetical protein